MGPPGTREKLMASDNSYEIDLSRRQLVFGGAMALTAAVAVAAAPHAGPPILEPGGLEKSIPTKVGDWTFTSSSGLVLPPQDENEKRVYDQVLTRVYTAPNAPPVMLLIAFGGGQTGLFEIHRPEACYPSQGYSLSDHVSVPLKMDKALTVPAVFWTAKGALRTEQLMYWTRIGDSFPVTWLDSKIAVVSSNLRRTLPDGALVRMSTISDEGPESLAALQNFAKNLVSSVDATGLRVLLGINRLRR